MKLSLTWWRAYLWARRRGVNESTSYLYANGVLETGRPVSPEGYDAFLQDIADFARREFPDLFS